jgi:hypothetical protein
MAPTSRGLPASTPGATTASLLAGMAVATANSSTPVEYGCRVKKQLLDNVYVLVTNCSVFFLKFVYMSSKNI